MGHHVVDGSLSIIILSKALTDTSRDVITIFQQLLILMLPLKLLSMLRSILQNATEICLPLVPPRRVWPLLYPGNIKKLHLKKTNTGREENITEPTVTTETDSKSVRTLGEKKKKKTGKVCKLTLANYGTIFKGKTCDPCLWHQNLIIIICLVILQTT